MSLINAFGNCCCEEIGHCCCFNSNDEQNCFGCLDDKTKAQCNATIGCRWVAGTCEDNPCLGVCCVSGPQDCYVDCISGVTECECFFEHQTAENNALFNPGATLTCEDVGCPCNCAPHCWAKYAVLKQDITHTRTACPPSTGSQTCISHIEHVYSVISNEYPCQGTQPSIESTMGAWVAQSSNQTYGCDANGFTGVYNVVNTASYIGRFSTVTSCYPIVPINIYNENSYAVNSGYGFFDCGEYNTTNPIYLYPDLCSVASMSGCTHQCIPACTEI